jgi:hypothetical protein
MLAKKWMSLAVERKAASKLALIVAFRVTQSRRDVRD